MIILQMELRLVHEQLNDLEIYYSIQMSYSIETRKLKKMINLYNARGHGEQINYMIYLKGQEELFMNLQTNPMQGISNNSVEERTLWFGQNVVRKNKNASILKSAMSRVLDYSFWPILVLCSLISVIGALLLNHNNLQVPHLEGGFLFTLNVISMVPIVVVEFHRKIDGSQLAKYQIGEVFCKVWRQNKKIQMKSCELVVGDIIQLQEGDQIGADGWLVNGDITVQERVGQYSQQLRKSTLKTCIIEPEVDKKQTLKHKMIKQQYLSPALLSGSIVKKGNGRMVVLCVGKLTRQGNFISHIQNSSFIRSLFEDRVIYLFQEIIKYAILSVIGLLIVLNGFQISELIINGSWKKIDVKQLMKLQILAIELIIAIVPNGLLIGLLIGVFYHKQILVFKQSITLKHCVNCLDMAAIQYICYDYKYTANCLAVVSFWNHCYQNRNQFLKEQMDQSDNKFEFSVSSILSFHPEFIRLLLKSLATDGKFMKNDQTHQELDQCFQREMQYILSHCNQVQKSIINSKNIILKDNQVFIQGNSQHIIKMCQTIIHPQTSEIINLTKSNLKIIKHTIAQMHNQMLKSVILAYKPKQNEGDAYCILAILGITQVTNSESEKNMMQKIKNTGTKLIMSSFSSYEQTVQKAKLIGLGISNSSLNLSGRDFQNLVGGSICMICHKSVCLCDRQILKVIKTDQFNRIIKKLEVLADADALQKHLLCTGLNNKNVSFAHVGTKVEDIPSMGISPLPIFVPGQQNHHKNKYIINAAQVFIPNHSLASIYILSMWSRKSWHFLRKFIQLMLTTIIVGGLTFALSLIVFKSDFLKIIGLMWVNSVLCSGLALFLAIDSPQEEQIMEDNVSIFQKQEPLITQTMSQHIFTQSFLQLMIIFLMTTLGHFFIPQSFDSIDQIIGENWSVKYASQARNRVANGIPFLIWNSTMTYNAIFNQYGIFSRHSTIIFNTFALMQIFNAVNCRKLSQNKYNIFQGLKFFNGVVILAVLSLQFFFVTYGGAYVGVYPNGMTFVQWIISFTISMLVWLMSFIVKLIPSGRNNQKKLLKEWPNKSYNLAVKATIPSSTLANFQVEEDLIFTQQNLCMKKKKSN